jgi:hypothetical protein
MSDTTRPGRRRKRPHRLILSALVGLLAATVLAIAVPSQASAAQPASYTVSKDWQYDWNGGCGAKATVTYYPATDTAVMNTTVTSPYLFAACRVRTHLQVVTVNAVFDGADQYATACAVLDPSCASTQSTGNQTFVGATPTFTGFVDALNAQLVALGLPPTTRQEVARGINVSFSRA